MFIIYFLLFLEKNPIFIFISMNVHLYQYISDDRSHGPLTMSKNPDSQARFNIWKIDCTACIVFNLSTICCHWNLI